MTDKSPTVETQQTARTDLSALVLKKSFQSAFYQSLQLIRCFDSCPGSPTTAAHLSLLFHQLELKSSLSNLHAWLAQYVDSYVAEQPRNQTDLAGKILAAAVYLNISDRNKIAFEVPERHLITYIEYAAEQSWLQDPFLAYYCSYLEESLRVCKEAKFYLRDNYELFLGKRNIVAISQTLLILEDDLSLQQRANGYEQLIRVSTANPSPIKHAAWALAALSKAQSPMAYTAFKQRLNEYLEQQLTEYSTQLVRKAGMPGLLALIWSGSDLTDAKQYFSQTFRFEQSQIYTSDLLEDDVLRLTIDLAALREQQSLPSLADVATALTALGIAGEHRVVGVPEVHEHMLQAAVAHAQRLQDIEAVVISKKENVLLNIIAVVVVLVVGVSICLYFMDAKFKYQWNLSQIEWRDWDVLLFAVFLLDYLYSMVRAIASGESVATGMIQLPLIRHLGSLKRGAVRISSHLNKEHDNAE